MPIGDIKPDAPPTPTDRSAIPKDVDVTVSWGITLLGGACAPALAALAVASARPLTAAGIFVICAVIAVNLWFTRYKVITLRDVNVSLSVVAASMFVIVLISGSPTPSALALLSLVPFMVASLGEKRSLIIWLNIHAAIVAAVYFHGSYLTTHYSEPPTNPVFQHFLHIAVLSIFITIIAYILMGRRNAYLNELTTANEQLTQKRNEARTASEQKGRFLSRLSHELRTPLNAILGFGEVMSHDREAMLTARQLERMEYIQTSAQRLLNIVDEVMEITGADGRASFPVLLPVSITSAITDAVKATSAFSSERKVSISLDASAFSASEALADRNALRRVLQELINNATLFNRAGGMINIRVESVSGQARISVEDTGKGIPADRLATVFEPFSQLHPGERGKSGSGLGLTMTKAIVQQMKGTIEVVSKVGHGSTFTIALPLYVKPDRHLPAARATSNEASQSARLVPTLSAAPSASELPNVLYVEDNTLNQLIMQAMFSQLGLANLHISSTGEEGFQQAVALRPDLLLLDIHLPDCSGNELLTRLRAEPSLTAISAIAVSADAVPQNINAAIEHGFDDYLTKPISIDALRLVLERRLPVAQGERR